MTKIIAVRPRPHYGNHPSRPPGTYVVGQSSGDAPQQPYHHTEQHYVAPLDDKWNDWENLPPEDEDEEDGDFVQNARQTEDEAREYSHDGLFLLITAIAFVYYFWED